MDVEDGEDRGDRDFVAAAGPDEWDRETVGAGEFVGDGAGDPEDARRGAQIGDGAEITDPLPRPHDRGRVGIERCGGLLGDGHGVGTPVGVDGVTVAGDGVVPLRSLISGGGAGGRDGEAVGPQPVGEGFAGDGPPGCGDLVGGVVGGG